MEVEPGVTSGDYLSGFFQGTRQALFENDRESLTITVERLDSRAVGTLIALYERAVGLYAGLVNINAYHQPGVEAGKKAAGLVLRLQGEALNRLLQEKKREFTAGDLAAAIGVPGETETLFHILLHLAANADHGIVMERRMPLTDSVFRSS